MGRNTSGNDVTYVAHVMSRRYLSEVGVAMLRVGLNAAMSFVVKV